MLITILYMTIEILWMKCRLDSFIFSCEIYLAVIFAFNLRNMSQFLYLIWNLNMRNDNFQAIWHQYKAHDIFFKQILKAKLQAYNLKMGSIIPNTNINCLMNWAYF